MDKFPEKNKKCKQDSNECELHIDQLPTIVINKDIGELNHTKKNGITKNYLCQS
ncbi:hypothetical protein T01_15967 [Trichinella spiralis]|uniref:Uncharacterized protein n=1 Tax=Trichinella spiralis TaxID=6334 RepID=A0A0V0YVT6_TRISP|nr:hypothetical protein T01_15967 [Trichinella spiralis]